MRVNKILKTSKLCTGGNNISENTQVIGHIYYFEISKYSGNYKNDASLESIYEYTFFSCSQVQ